MKNKLYNEAQAIQEFLQQERVAGADTYTEGTLLSERGDKLSAYMARTGEMLAQSKFLLNTEMAGQVAKFIERVLDAKSISAKVQNSYIEALCREERFLVDWIERINKTCSHQLNWTITQVSKLKEEMKLGGY